MTTTTTTIDLIEINPVELTATDLRFAAAQAILLSPDPSLDRDAIAEILEGSPKLETFGQPAVVAYRCTVEGSPEPAQVLVILDAVDRIGVAWGADADWMDLPGGPHDLTTVGGGDAFAGAVWGAVRTLLADAQ